MAKSDKPADKPKDIDPNCGTCRYWNREFKAKGRCRRYPPLVLIAPGGSVCGHPDTNEEHWCGEYQRKN